MTQGPFGWVRETTRIAAVCTVYNRRELTLHAMSLLADQQPGERAFSIEVFILDDGSIDGTAAALSTRYPYGVHVMRGRGNQYWASGMASAQRAAERHVPDHILWFNDDIQLQRGALLELLQVSSQYKDRAIVVGAMTEPGSTQVSYSGTRLQHRRPGSLQLVVPNGNVQHVDTFHGNLVLVPRSAYSTLGTVDDAFSHAYGDNDYGLRARQKGIDVVLAPHPLGRCARNDLDRVWMDASISRRSRTRALFGRKGLPVESHLRYNIRHGGVLPGMIYAAAAYSRELAHIWLHRKMRSKCGIRTTLN